MAIDLSSLGAVPVPDNPTSTGTALGAAARGALGMVPLGEQAYAGADSAFNHQTYGSSRDALRKQIQDDIDNNAGPRLAGQVAGVVAPIVATGGLAAPETLAGAVGQGALFGGASGLGNAIDTVASGGTAADAAKDVAVGTGLGALGGGVGKGITDVAGAALGKLGETQAAQRLHTENVTKVLGLQPRALASLAKGTSTPEDAAQKLWQDLRSIPGLPDDFVSPTSSINDKLSTLKGLKQQAGEAIGETRNLGGHATAGNFPEGEQAMQDLVTEANNFKGIPDGTAEALKGVAAQIQAAKDTNNLDFNTLSQIRTMVGDQVRREVPGSNQVYRILSNHLDKTLDRVGETSGIDKAAFGQAKKTYSLTSKILPLMARGAGREAAGTGGGLANLLGVGGLLSGHPATVAAPIAHEVSKLIAPEMMRNVMLGGVGNTAKTLAGNLPLAGASVAAHQMQDNPTSVPLNHPAMAHWKQTFQQDAAHATTPAETDKANAVTDFRLSQSNPAYAAAKQKALDDASNAPSKPKQAPNMADGGIVPPAPEHPTVWDTVKAGKPIPGFGSTLDGFQNMVDKPVADEAAQLVVEPKKEYKKPFNSNMEEQLKKYLLSSQEE